MNKKKIGYSRHQKNKQVFIGNLNQNSSFKSNLIDATFFWTFQIVSTCYWVILYTGNFLLSLVNLIGFYKCRGGLFIHL